jgi:hypothetical protein
VRHYVVLFASYQPVGFIWVRIPPNTLAMLLSKYGDMLIEKMHFIMSLSNPKQPRKIGKNKQKITTFAARIND